MNIPKLIEKCAKHYHDKTAVIFGDKRFTFKETNERTNRLATGLLNLGIKKGDVLASLNRNCHQHIEIFLARQKTGTVELLLNTRLSNQELAWQINDSETSAIFVAEEFLDRVRSILPSCPTVRHVIAIDGARGNEIDYEAILASGNPDGPPELGTDLHEDEMGAIMYTSGTTGKAKGIVHSRRLYWAITRNLLLDQIPDLSFRDVFLGLQPLYHAAWTYILPCWLRGTPHVIVTEFQPRVAFDAIEKEKVTVIKTVPTVLLRIMADPGLPKRDISSVRTIIYGASPMPAEPLKQAVRVFGPILVQNYGQSEAPMTICLLRKEDHVVDGPPEKVSRLSSIGRPYTLMEVRVVNDEGKDVVPGEIGEVIVRGDNMMKYYLKLPGETGQTLKDGWVYTRDLAKVDEEGYIFLVDRKSEMIISGGLNVYPNEVEQVLYEHPAVLEAAVFGVPDKEWGESVKVVVALKPGMSATEAELIDFCKERLAAYKKPKSVDFMESLPKSPEGKVLRRELKDPYWAGVERRIH